MSGAADPETGFVYVGSNTAPTIIGLNPNPNASKDDPDQNDYLQGGPQAPQIPGGLRLLKPPYGRITGYDMNQGTVAFTIPNGDTPPNIKAQFEQMGLKNIPPTGAPSQAHLLVTKNFLFATEGSGGQAILHAYDKKTGAGIWQAPMPAGPASGVPMTYMLQGKQYIVHAARGPQGGGAQLVAWTVTPQAPAGAGGRGGRGARGARGGAAAPAPAEQ
jgi:quinoprotein glucose dehydrogenase